MRASLNEYLKLAGPVHSPAVIRYYLAYGSSSLLILAALGLLLPVLRDAGQATGATIRYELTAGPLSLSFALPWWVPFLCLAVAIWAVALGKRTEYAIWRSTHADFKARYAALCASGGDDGSAVKPRRIEASARARAIAVRHLALLGMDAAAVFALLLILVWFEPVTAPLAALLATSLGMGFRSAIWQAPGQPVDNTEDMEPAIRHRVRLVNARQVFSALMPLTVLALLLLVRVWDGLRFDLADLILISFMVNALGGFLGSSVQHLLYLRRVDPLLLAPWPHLRAGRLAEAQVALRLPRERGSAEP